MPKSAPEVIGVSLGPFLQVVFLGMVAIAIIAIVLGVIALRSLSNQDKPKR